MVLWQVIFWAVVAIALIVIELTSAQLVSIWFGLSAVVVFGLTFTGITFTNQLLIFGIISAILLVVTRPFAKKITTTKAVLTNADAIIGCECIVQIDVSNEVGGRVLVAGKDWSARISETIENTTLEKGSKCIIEEIKGVTLIVKPLNV